MNDHQRTVIRTARSPSVAWISKSWTSILERRHPKCSRGSLKNMKMDSTVSAIEWKYRTNEESQLSLILSHAPLSVFQCTKRLFHPDNKWPSVRFSGQFRESKLTQWKRGTGRQKVGGRGPGWEWDYPKIPWGSHCFHPLKNTQASMNTHTCMHAHTSMGIFFYHTDAQTVYKHKYRRTEAARLANK